MPYLVERLAELRRHLPHLRDIAPRVTERALLERELSLHNDVLFSLLMVAQLERVPGFRNVIIHDYVTLDLGRVVDALRRLEPIEEFVQIVAAIESAT